MYDIACGQIEKCWSALLAHSLLIRSNIFSWDVGFFFFFFFFFMSFMITDANVPALAALSFKRDLSVSRGHWLLGPQVSSLVYSHFLSSFPFTLAP